jgi:hypothetical protein
MRKLHGLLAASAVVAAVAALFETESIIVTCPVMAVLGIGLALVAERQRRVALLVHGLIAALATAALALAIAVFHWGPNQAEAPALIILTSTAVASVALLSGMPDCWLTADAAEATPPSPVRFSMRTVLLSTTVLCALLAIGRWLEWRGEMAFFAAYGVATIVASATIALRHVARRKAASTSVAAGVTATPGSPPADPSNSPS